MLFICYPKCTTCQKAQKWLDQHNVSYDIRNIKKNRPTYDELKQWLPKSDQSIKKLFNTSGLVYRSLDLKDKLPEMSEDECLQALATDGMLVKRPLLITENRLLIGFKEPEWEKEVL